MSDPQPQPSYDDLAALVKRQTMQIDDLIKQVAAPREGNADLRRRLGMDSSNSSKQPSSDGLARKPR